jgi:methyl-accepting chemotaxis protein
VSGMSKGRKVVERGLTPAANLIGRLRYSRKFLLIGLVLLAPLGYVVKSFLDQQSGKIAFSADERVGVVYVKPATELLARVVAARAAAVDAAAHKSSPTSLAVAQEGVKTAIAPLDAANAAVGAQLKVAGEWSRIRQQIETTGTPGGSADQTLARYDAVTAALLKLIVDAGNYSNLILDPDLDSYYVMDSVINRLPMLVDAAGQAGDMQTAISDHGAATIVKRIDLAVLKGNIETTLANSDANYATALGNTKDGALKPQLSSPISATDSSLKAVAANLTTAVRTGRLDSVGATRRAGTATADLMALDRLSLPALDHLLAVRIAGFQVTATRVKAIALICVLIALYLFAGFYLSVRRSQTAILDGLQELQTGGTDLLADGLDGASTGDLTRHVDHDLPPIQIPTRDEIGDVAVAVNVIREGVIASISSFNAMTTQLRAMLSEVSASAGAVSAASEQMSSTSEEAGRATGEIAQAVGDVAQGAERQVVMVDEARRAADDVARAIGESATGAQQTAQLGQEARRAAGDGVAAAVQASEAMQSVRDSSRAVTEAISGLAEKSEQIGAIVQTITGIAEQTNLLALNAAIEAARAGEQGRGFAVVAEEVRKLAEESQEAAAQIAGLIGAIQVETSKTVAVVQEGAQRTGDGASVVEQTREAFERIGVAVDDMTARVEQIATASEATAAGASRMQASITEVAAVSEESSASAEQVSASTQETAAAAQQISASARELARTAETLEQLVTRFRLSV